MADNYDLIVIGAGPGGYVGAIKAAQRGMAVALVEKAEVGGTCLNRGCVPTKALLHATRLYREVQQSGDIGLVVQGLAYDMDKMYAHKNKVVGELRGGVEALLAANKITFIQGEGCITAPGAVQVMTAEGELWLSAKNILVATGSAPALPPIEGLGTPGVITSDDVLKDAGMDLRSLVIIGGGVIGVELASVYAALGCKLTIIEAMSRILPTMDREIAQNLAMILKKRGVTLFTGATVQRVQAAGNLLNCTFACGDATQQAKAQAVLVAVGRKPGFEGIFAREMRPECNRGIVVNAHFETSVPGVYAVGDVVDGGIQLAHMASAQAANAVAHMAGEKPPIGLGVVPACVYTDPEIAQVGMTADEAKQQGLDVMAGKFIMSANARSVIQGAERSFIKLVFRREDRVLMGAQLMCERATDMVSELATAISCGLTQEQVAGVIRAHPTFAEGVTEAAEDALGLAVHLAPKRR